MLGFFRQPSLSAPQGPSPASVNSVGVVLSGPSYPRLTNQETVLETPDCRRVCNSPSVHLANTTDEPGHRLEHPLSSLIGCRAQSVFIHQLSLPTDWPPYLVGWLRRRFERFYGDSCDTMAATAFHTPPTRPVYHAYIPQEQLW